MFNDPSHDATMLTARPSKVPAKPFVVCEPVTVPSIGSSSCSCKLFAHTCELCTQSLVLGGEGSHGGRIFIRGLPVQVATRERPPLWGVARIGWHVDERQRGVCLLDGGDGRALCLVYLWLVVVLVVLLRVRQIIIAFAHGQGDDELAHFCSLPNPNSSGPWKKRPV